MGRLSAFLVALLLAAPALATGGALISATGEVWLLPKGGQEERAKAGAQLEDGTHIRTGRDGSAEVKFADGSLLRVRPGSKLRLSSHPRKQQKKSTVLLFFGRVWSKVSKAVGSDSNYEVATANAVCGVRGTEFETAVADDGSVRVRVSEGEVGVGEGEEVASVTAGTEVEATEDGVESPANAEEQARWDAWEKRKRQRLRKDGKDIVDGIKQKIMGRKAQLEAMRAEQKALEAKRKAAEESARSGDKAALEAIRGYNQRLAVLADAIADLGDVAACQFETVDHFADLAADPRFKMVNRKYIEKEAKSLRRIKAMFDQMVAEGTDISIEAMDKMINDMGEGSRNTLKDDQGSSADDLFTGDDDLEMDNFR